MNPSEYVQRSRAKNKIRILGVLGSKCNFCAFDKAPSILVPVSRISGQVVRWGTIFSLSKEKADRLLKTEDLALACPNCLALSQIEELEIKRPKKGGVFQMLRDRGLMPAETVATVPTKSLVPEAASVLISEDLKKRLEAAIAELDLEDD